MIRGFKTLLTNDAAVNAIINGAVYPVKIPLDEPTPAVVVQMVGGMPENYLAENPGIDNGVYQFGLWAKDMTTVDALLVAVRDVIQTIGMIVAYHGSDFDEETMLYGFRFDASIWDSR